MIIDPKKEEEHHIRIENSMRHLQNNKYLFEKTPVTVLVSRSTTDPLTFGVLSGEVKLVKRIENCYGLKVNYFNLEDEGETIQKGFIRLLNSQVLGSLMRKNEFQTASDQDVPAGTPQIMEAQSNIIAWNALRRSNNANTSSQADQMLVNGMHYFGRLYTIENFDWYVSMLDGSIGFDTTNVQFVIEFHVL
jgi:hypothetical protein